MAGLDPAILFVRMALTHETSYRAQREDGRIKSGHDVEWAQSAKPTHHLHGNPFDSLAAGQRRCRHRDAAPADATGMLKETPSWTRARCTCLACAVVAF